MTEVSEKVNDILDRDAKYSKELTLAIHAVNKILRERFPIRETSEPVARCIGMAMTKLEEAGMWGHQALAAEDAVMGAASSLPPEMNVENGGKS